MTAFAPFPVLLVFLAAGCLESTSAQACGTPSVSSRIVGGQDAVEGAWPWQVSLQVNGVHVCGGTLISDSWVVTAAHCYHGQGFSASAISVCLGQYQLSYSNPNGVCYQVQNLIENPIFTKDEGPGDIMLLGLANPVTFSDYIMPVCLPAPDVRFPSGVHCFVTGWGQISSGISLGSPQTLQQVMVLIIDQPTCDNLYHVGSSVSSDTPIILSDMICAGYAAGGKDACQGDSGGPLVCKADGAWYLAGVVSWGSGCAEVNRPGVYTLITAYNSWIQQNVPSITFYEKVFNRAGSKNFMSVALLLFPFLLLLLLNEF